MNSRGGQALYIAVSVDGGKPVRIGLVRGPNDVVLAEGLSGSRHRLMVRKEGEPGFGALQFSSASLEVAGRWLAPAQPRPIVEVIGDSDATGICALGPDSPADAVSIWNSSWASEGASWVGLLEAGLSALGHPVEMVDLAISGSKTGSEARTYRKTAPGFNEAQFPGYAPGAHRHASLVLMWGGGNDRHGGGDVAAAAPPTYGTLSRFERGLFEQVSEVMEDNPQVRIVLLEYTDPAIPDWQRAYDEVVSLFGPDERQRIFHLKVYDPQGTQDACRVDPDGHPNLFLHASWAAQILAWTTAPGRIERLGLPTLPEWAAP